MRDRFGSRILALAIALTGIIATMPYIALQLVGMEVVIGALGFPTSGFAGHLPLIIAFVVLAAFTYTTGLRAPALIAVVKDMLIFVTIFAAVVVIPAKLGGYGAIFAAVPPEKLILPEASLDNFGKQSAYVTLALGSALALFLYPHAMTGILSASSGDVIRRNAGLLAAYSFILGLIALLGYMAIAAGVDKDPAYASGFSQYGPNFAVPALFLASFPSWFVGVAFAAIAIGALVPAAIMSIACANLYTRNLYKEFLRPHCSAAEEARMAKIVSLVVKIGAVVVHPRHPASLCHPAPAPRRHLDHPASPADPARPLYARVQCAGAADRMGRRHRRRHLYGGDPELHLIGLSARDFWRHSAGLCGALLGRGQFSRRRAAHAAVRSRSKRASVVSVALTSDGVAPPSDARPALDSSVVSWTASSDNRPREGGKNGKR